MSRGASPRWLAAIVLAALATPASPADGPRSLDVDWAVDGAVTGGALAVWGASELAKGALSPPACRWCTPPGLDADVRRAVAWSSTGTPAAASDALMLAIPAGVAAYDLLAARAAGDAGAAGRDLLVVAEAVAVSGVLTQTVKYATARLRPYARSGAESGRDDHASFWSGHTAAAFSAAAAGGMVAQLRGRPGWPWVYGLGLAAAGATGYFRMAADRHWLTDVLAGAAAGTAVGLAVPWLHRGGAKPAGPRLVLAPGGVGFGGTF